MGASSAAAKEVDADPRWSNAALDEARRRCDPLADALIELLEKTGQYDHVMARFHGKKPEKPGAHAPPPEVQAALDDYLAKVQLPAQVDWARVRKGQELFATFGSEMLLVLGLYALPAAFAAAHGVKAVYWTANLRDHPLRRLWETCQFVVDVLEPGGLDASGRGVKAAQMVRLFHARVRYGIRHGQRPPDQREVLSWEAEKWGEPINQEDLAGTLTEFGYIVLDGLERLGIDLTPEEKDAYVYLWWLVGGLLGVDDNLRAQTTADARVLAGKISARQIAPSREGQELTAKLLEAFASKVPPGLGSLPRTFLRLFLSHDPYRGNDVAAVLGVTSAGWTWALVPVFQYFSGLHDRLTDRLGTSNMLVRWLSGLFLGLFLETARTTDRPARFYVPDHLHRQWRTRERQKQRKRPKRSG